MTATTLSTPRLPSAAIAAVVLWFGAVVLAGATGFLVRLPFPGAQVIILGLFVATLAAATAVPALRVWVDALPLRVLIGSNVLRFVGAVFLMYGAWGKLNPIFAARAGWGDIAVAALALGLVMAGEPRTAWQRGVTHLWNALGFLDLATAVGTATWVIINGLTPRVDAVLMLPLVLIPAFFVPIYLAIHVVIFRRLLAEGRAADGR